jgi:8-oxo-dGTP pyrophosphatase MutT (NUDIX family)
MIVEESESDNSAVAVIFRNGRVLLGLSTAADSRNGTWCFPGGHIKTDEEAIVAAVREAKEETGLDCDCIKYLGQEKDGKVKFFKCIAKSGLVRPNDEFSSMKFIATENLDDYKLFHNVLKFVRLSE